MRRARVYAARSRTPGASAHRRWVPGLLLLLTGLAALTQLDVFAVGVVRPALVFGFLLVAPGAALLGLVRLDGVTALVLAVALSLVLLTLVSELVVLVGAWPLETGFWVLVGISVLGSVLQLLRRGSPAPPDAAPPTSAASQSASSREVD
jgi:hypothetical protein